MFRTLVLTSLLGLATAAQASSPTEDCVRTKVWDTYGDGWAVRSSADAEVGFGKTQFFRVSLLKGRTYRVVSCGDENFADLDILLYDKDGNVVARDESTDREPSLSYSPDKTGAFFVVVYGRDLTDASATSPASWALLHSD